MRMSAYEHEHKHKQDYSNNMRKKLKSCLSHKKKLIRLRSFYLSWEFIQMEARFCGMKEKRDRTAFLICIIAARTFHHFMLKKITLVWLCMRMHEINLWYNALNALKIYFEVEGMIGYKINEEQKLYPH